MKHLTAVFLTCLLLAGLAAPCRAADEIVRELTSNGTLGSDYQPRSKEYRLNPLSDFHYSSDPFLREKKAEGKKDDSRFQFSFGAEERTNPITGERIEPNRSDNPLDAVGGKVQMDVNVMEF